MPIVCGVQFRGTGKVYYFSPGDLPDIQVDDQVVVKTSRGEELAQVIMPPEEVDDSKVVGDLKSIERLATSVDLLEDQKYRQKEPEAMEQFREAIVRFNLPMKAVSAEYSYDGSRLSFLFTAEQRVDFRHLVRELAGVFKTRIDLRHVGVRDEAKAIGGVGKCGRNLCCATWLTHFSPVSIRMAKQQNLPLSPMEISGVCGRLLCCLTYENDYYKEVQGKFPKVGKTLDTPHGPGKVVKVSVLKETVNVLLEDGSFMELTADQLEGKSPVSTRGLLLTDAQRKAIDVSVGTPAASAKQNTVVPGRRPADGARQAQERTEDGGDDSGSRSKRRRRSRRKRSSTGPSGAQPDGATPSGRGSDNQPSSGDRRRDEGSGSDRAKRPRPSSDRGRRSRRQPDSGPEGRQ